MDKILFIKDILKNNEILIKKIIIFNFINIFKIKKKIYILKI